MPPWFGMIWVMGGCKCRKIPLLLTFQPPRPYSPSFRRASVAAKQGARTRLQADKLKATGSVKKAKAAVKKGDKRALPKNGASTPGKKPKKGARAVNDAGNESGSRSVPLDDDSLGGAADAADAADAANAAAARSTSRAAGGGKGGGQQESRAPRAQSSDGPATPATAAAARRTSTSEDGESKTGGATGDGKKSGTSRGWLVARRALRAAVSIKNANQVSRMIAAKEDSSNSSLGQAFLDYYTDQNLHPYTEAHVPHIEVAMKVNKISDMDQVAQTFRVEFTLMLDWEDPSLQREKETLLGEKIKAKPVDWGAHFNPKVEIMHVVEGGEEGQEIQVRERGRYEKGEEEMGEEEKGEEEKGEEEKGGREKEGK